MGKSMEKFQYAQELPQQTEVYDWNPGNPDPWSQELSL